MASLGHIELYCLKPSGTIWIWYYRLYLAGLILGLRPANERRCYKVTPIFHWLGPNLESALYGLTGLFLLTPLCAEFFSENIKIYLHFLSFLDSCFCVILREYPSLSIFFLLNCLNSWSNLGPLYALSQVMSARSLVTDKTSHQLRLTDSHQWSR